MESVIVYRSQSEAVMDQFLYGNDGAGMIIFAKVILWAILAGLIYMFLDKSGIKYKGRKIDEKYLLFFAAGISALLIKPASQLIGWLILNVY